MLISGSLLVAAVWMAAQASATPVLPLPTAATGMNPADVAEIDKRLVADLVVRPGVSVPDGAAGVAAVIEAAGDDLATCRQDPVCTGQLGDAAGADFVLVPTLEQVGTAVRIEVVLVQASDGSVAGRLNRLVEGEILTVAEQVRLTAAALVRRFAPRATGHLTLEVSEDDARFTLDGERQADLPSDSLEVQAGAHVILLEKEEFQSFSRAVEVPVDGNLALEVELKPSADYASSYATTAWIILGTSVALGVLGGVFAAGGAGSLAGAFFLAGATNEAIRAYNELPASQRTAEQQQQLLLQTNLVYVLDGVGAAAAALGLVLLGGGAGLLLFARNPFRYDE